MSKQIKSFPVLLSKADGDLGIVEAFVSVFGNIDYGDDIITNGAFTKTITERGGKIRVLDNHNSWSTEDAIAKIVDIKEVGKAALPPELLLAYPDATGALFVKMQFMLDDEKSMAVFKRIKSDVINEYSIGFQIMQSEYREVETDAGKRSIRYITEIKLYEVSPVIFAMNDATTTVGAKDKDGNKGDEPSLSPKQVLIGYTKAMDDSACRSCAFYGKVTEEMGYCKQHEMPCGAMMRCPDYKTIEKNLVANALSAMFASMMQEAIAQLMELGAWVDDDKELLETMLDAITDGFLNMLPAKLTQLEMPQAETLTTPKNLDPEAEPQKALTSDAAVLERAALLKAKIQERMTKQAKQRR